MARKRSNDKNDFKFWMIVIESEAIRTAQREGARTPEFTKIVGPHPSVVFGTKERAEEIARKQCRNYGETFYVLEAVSCAEIKAPPVEMFDL